MEVADSRDDPPAVAGRGGMEPADGEGETKVGDGELHDRAHQSIPDGLDVVGATLDRSVRALREVGPIPHATPKIRRCS